MRGIQLFIFIESHVNSYTEADQACLIVSYNRTRWRCKIHIIILRCLKEFWIIKISNSILMKNHLHTLRHIQSCKFTEYIYVSRVVQKWNLFRQKWISLNELINLSIWAFSFFVFGNYIWERCKPTYLNYNY